MPELTFGGRAVGLDFNPSKNEEVEAIKQAGANFVDTIVGPSGAKIEHGADDGEVIAMRKLAMRAAQEASMWAVKAATYGK